MLLVHGRHRILVEDVAQVARSRLQCDYQQLLVRSQ